jgi:hypothetical protein
MGHIHGPLFGFQVHAKYLLYLMICIVPAQLFVPPPPKKKNNLTPKDISVIVLDFTGGVNWT